MSLTALRSAGGQSDGLPAQKGYVGLYRLRARGCGVPAALSRGARAFKAPKRNSKGATRCVSASVAADGVSVGN